jgi:hypothetical protein
MDQYTKFIYEKRAEKAIKNLKINRMDARYFENKDLLIETLKDMLPKGAVIGCGGSMTLVETGVMNLIKSGDYHYIEREGRDLATEEEKFNRLREVYFADYLFMSSNAITEDGMLYNVDGRGNRVSPMIYGPKNVVVIAGLNKIVKNLDEAMERVKTVSAPANSARLNHKTPCAKTGFCADCKTPDRTCCSGVWSAYQRTPDRVKVFIIGKEYGY